MSHPPASPCPSSSADEPVLVLDNVGKRFKRYRRRRDRLLELFRGKCLHTDLVAVAPLTLSVAAGSILGIIGENGSGKSTLLKLIAGILLPDSGTIRRNGRVTGLLELGTGFNLELSGRKNIAFNGIYLGMSLADIEARARDIIAFSELAEAIDAPLKSYSSGMIMRLGFSIAIHADPDCFLIDEALAVGDVRFQQKCFERLRAYRAQGGALIFVSHDMNAVKLLCDRAMVLHQGSLRFLGPPDEAVHLYNKITAPADTRTMGPLNTSGFGNGAVSFTAVSTCDDSGRSITVLTSGDPLVICFTYHCAKPTKTVSFGISIRDRFGQDVFGTNGALLGVVKDIHTDGHGTFRFPAMNIAAGFYTVNLAAHTGTTHLENCFHWWDKATAFEVVQDPHFIFGGHTRLAVSLALEDEAKA